MSQLETFSLKFCEFLDDESQFKEYIVLEKLGMI
jgi:hypothetical protein